MKKLKGALTAIFYNLSLRSKLILSYLLIIAIVVVGLACIPYVNFYRSAVSQSGNAYMEALRQAEKNIRYGISSANIIAEQAQVNDEAQKILSTIASRELTSAEEIDFFTILSKSIAAFYNTKYILKTTYFVNGNPGFVSANPHFLNIKDLQEEDAALPVFTGASNHLWLYASDFTSISLQSPDEIVYIQRIVSLSNINTVLGYIMVELDSSVVSTVLSDIGIPNEMAILIRRNGQFISSYGITPENDEIVGAYLEAISKDKQGISRNISGSVVYYAIANNISELNWDITLVVTEKNLGMASMETRRFITITTLIVSVLSVFFAIVISGSITKRLKRLMALIRSAEKGEFKTERNVIGNDEYSQLLLEFNKMSIKIKELIEEVYQAKISKQATEMKLLYAQINPHFLYNTLDIIQWSAMKIGAEDIADMTRSLATELRLSLNGGKEIITVDEEIESVSSYMRIINRRYKDAIGFEAHVQEQTGSIKIIKMILQPLVENAVIHGILMKPDKSGSISIRVWRDGEFLLLEVQDDGVGISPEHLPFITNADSSGYGVKNVHQRIQVYYGNECGLYFYNNSSGGCTVTAKIKIDLCL